MKILIISGHGAGDSGAVGNGAKEADLTRTAAAELVAAFNSYDVSVTRYPASRNAYEDNKHGKLATGFGGYDLIVELHFNSYNKTAHGVEVLYKAPRMKSLATKICAAIASFGFSNRGPKVRMNMNTCFRLGVGYVLIETCFIDNADDMKLYRKNITAIWKKVAAAVCSQYGIKELASKSNPVKTDKTKAKKAYSGTWPTMPKKEYFAKGDKGVNVGRLQAFLNWYGGYGLAVDDSFGPATEKAVKAYQKAEGLTVDGYFGPKSLAHAKTVKK